MKAFLKAALSLTLLFLVAGVAFADQTGEIRGTVTDVSGGPLPGVLVTARSPSLQGQRTAVSDARGAFRLPLLPVGTYELAFALPGFDGLTLAGNEVGLGQTITVPVTMKLAGITGAVTVTSENPLIDATRADTSYRLSGEELARIPAQGRTIAEVVGFTPGVTGVRVNTVTGTDTGLPSFRGEGDAGNNWLVDGLSTKGVQKNDAGVRINYDAWEEVQVVSDGFSPELGQTMGGVVNVVTKSGGNALPGRAGRAREGPESPGRAPGAALGREPAGDLYRSVLRQLRRTDPEGQALVLPLRQLFLDDRPDDGAVGRLAGHSGGRIADDDEQRLREDHASRRRRITPFPWAGLWTSR